MLQDLQFLNVIINEEFIFHQSIGITPQIIFQILIISRCDVADKFVTPAKAL